MSLVRSSNSPNLGTQFFLSVLIVQEEEIITRDCAEPFRRCWWRGIWRRWQVANIAIHHPKECAKGVLVGGDRVEVTHWQVRPYERP
jgi:hypothetical protein